MLKLNFLIYHFLWMTEQLFGTKKISWTVFRNYLFDTYMAPKIASPNFFSEIEVIEINFLDEQTIKNLPLNKPLIFKNLANSTQAVQNWNWDHLKSVMGNADQPYTDTFSSNSFNSGIKNSNEIFQNLLSDNPQFSIMFGDILIKNSSLMSDLQTKKWIDLKAFIFKLNKSWKFFAAGKGRNTNLHCELGSGLIIQVIGEKKWTIFSPKFSTLVYPKINWKMYIESAKFPDFSKVRDANLGIQGYEVILTPGDVLYCPAYFWHFTTCETPAVSISWKWTEPMNFFRYPFLSLCVLTSRYPATIFRLPGLKRFSKIHPPIG